MDKVSVNSNCPNCGAPIEFDRDAQAFICKYCSSVVAISSSDISHQESGEANLPVLRKVEPELKYQANHKISSMNAQGGHLWITKDEVVFKPHALNMGPLGKRYIRIQDVIGYKKGSLTNMSIFTKDGYEMAIVVWKKDEIIQAIESRRINYYKSQNMPVPSLQYTDGVNYANSNIGDGGIPANQLSGNSGCIVAIVTFVIIVGTMAYTLF